MHHGARSGERALILQTRGAGRSISQDRNSHIANPLHATVAATEAVEGREGDWVRLYRPDGTLVPTEAEAELARLRALLDERSRG